MRIRPGSCSRPCSRAIRTPCNWSTTGWGSWRQASGSPRRTNRTVGPTGPAIFRIHYAGHRYQPHVDHAGKHERRSSYAVSRFEHQFAGVLCMQNSRAGGRIAQSILHRCLWTPELEPCLQADGFADYAAANAIEHYQVDLQPGDLYFFNTGLVHEVPALEGSSPRVVLAVFIGYSADDPEVFVWS